MNNRLKLMRAWSLLVPLLLLAWTGCGADSAPETESAQGAPGYISADDKAELDAIQQELSLRPLCSECNQICKPLRGYFKSLCTRACQKACVNDCEACKNNCRSLPGSQRQQCLNACSSSPACGGAAKCGNGRVEGSEGCDDGNTTNGDGCSSTCRIEEPVCGNGRLEGSEACDDGNLTNGDGCSSSCTREPVCSCGDGVLCLNEQCDDGNSVSNDGCSAACVTERCGDRVVQTSRETCDDGNTASDDGCSATCQSERCGDGVKQASEGCDDGNATAGDGCSATCTIEPVPECGDGNVDAALNEECDDQNRVSNDGCSADCKTERCGDGVKQTSEACDDGNTTANDGCGPTCIVEACGDGVLQVGEQCDDGNAQSNDGCGNCRRERCGDGIKQTSEGCDDGNTIPGDGCELNCSTTAPSCVACRNLACRSYVGIDLVAGCFEAVNPEFGAPQGDPNFIQHCVNVLSCARTNRCATGEQEAAGCYCGSASIDDCQSTGPAADAPCVPQWQAATRTTLNAEVQTRFTDLSYPAGWAYFLLDCDRQFCNSDAVGDCTKPAPVKSSQAAYVVPVAPGVTTRAVLTVGDSANAKPDGTPYRMVGIPDGSGAFDNGDGTFTWLVNHELGTTAGIARKHGGTGAFVSRWIVRKSDLGVVRGEDLISNVFVWDTATSSYAAGSNVQFGRFCSADLPALGAFFNAASSTGYNGQLFMNGEENGSEGRAMAHALDGRSWELPRLGKASWENIVASPFAQAKTVVAGIDDTTPGQVYIYVGSKTNIGTPVERAGLTSGTLYGVAVTGFPTEPSVGGIPTGAFTLASLGNVENTTGAALDTASTAANVTRFNRPEDGVWDPAHPSDFYFVTTNAITAPSRLWRLRFADIAQPELGGTVEMLLDGSEGQIMLDNMSMDARGHIILQEDPGNNARIAQVFRYDVATDRLVTIAQHNPALFTTGSPTFITQDEEASGAIDATSILGAGWWLLVDQIHAPVAGELVEQGQLTALFDPGSL